MWKTKWLLKQKSISVFDVDVPPGHMCSICQFKLADEYSKIFDTLPPIEGKVSTEQKETLVDIAGYVTRQNASSEDDTLLYHEESGRYTRTIDRGGLKHGTDSSYLNNDFIIFSLFNDVLCRKPLSGMRGIFP